jgi:hypothetical protein
MECLHRSRYKFKIEVSLKRWLLKNPDPLQNLRDSDVTRCSSGSDIDVEHGLEINILVLILRRIFLQ